MKKRILSVILAAAMVMATLTGCGSSSSGATVTEDTLSKVITSQKLVVGCILTNEPYGSYDDEGNPIGYDVDIAYLLADSLGIPHENVEFLDVSAAERIPALESGKCDVVIGNFTIILDRAQKVEFTDPYNAGATGVLTLKGNEIEHATELAGKKVAASMGTTNQQSADRLVAAGVDMEVVLTDGTDDLTALQSGQVDAIISDVSYAAYIASKYPEKYSYCVTDYTEMLVEPFYDGFGVKKGDQIWLNYLNKFIFQINLDGSNAALYEKWLGYPREIPLNPEY